MTHHPVRKAVFPVAGLGTRFLPATKAMPKEMLPIGHKPLIQHVVEEAHAAGIEEFIFVTSPYKGMLEDHFMPHPELEAILKAKHKDEMLKAVQDAKIDGELHAVIQDKPLGLGHAIWCARDFVGDEPFAVLLPDVLVHGGESCLAQMIDHYQDHGGNIIAVEDVPRDQTYKYGIVDTGGKTGDAIPVKGLVEKPDPAKAPSTLSIIGRYILQPQIFEHLSAFEKGAGGEIQLTDAMAKLIGIQPFHAARFEGKTYDCGHLAGFIEANIAFNIHNPEIQNIVNQFATEPLTQRIKTKK